MASIIQDMAQLYMREADRITRIDAYIRGGHDKPYIPATATREYRLLAERAVTNWLPLVVDVMAQTLYVDGYRTTGDESSEAWDSIWLPNGLDAGQSAVHRGALTYGTSYAMVLPGEVPGVVSVRAYSPRRMIAAYEEPDDRWPLYAFRVARVPGGWKVYLYDDETVTEYTVGSLDELDRASGSTSAHGAPWCPVIRFQDCPDLDGRTMGQVEPLIPIQDRINQTTFDLLVAQTYGSFKVRTISGMATPVDEAGKPISTIELSIKRFLTAEDPDVKFGQLDETSLQGYLESLDLTVRHMAAISQTPPHALLGQMANLSAEALVAAESGLTRKADERRQVFGQAWENLIRLGAAILGDVQTFDDDGGQVIWRDAEARSLAQTVDALGKAAQMLGIPVQALWERIPGVTLQDVERWKELAAAGDPIGQLNALLTAQETPTLGLAPEVA